jgi:PPOX class probable F420-dependent enzyme
VVPVTFAVAGTTVLSAVDHKPKTTRRLQRLANIEQNPIVSLVADHYEADWSMLWWVRVDGKARVAKTNPGALRELSAKYPQYSERPPSGPFVVIEMDRVSWWAANTQ